MLARFTLFCLALPLTGFQLVFPLGESTSLSEPPQMREPVVINGTLTDDDAARADGQKADRLTRVAVPPGSELRVLMTSDVFDTYLIAEVVGTDQRKVNDDFGSTSRSYLAVANAGAAPIEVDIVASGYTATGRGAYVVQYEVYAPPPMPEGEPLTQGTTEGSLTDASPRVPLIASGAERPASVYEIAAFNDRPITLRMESEAFDTYLLVLRHGHPIVRNDDYQGSRAVSQVTFTPAAGETYTVLAGAFAESGRGAYSLAWRPAATPAAAETAAPRRLDRSDGSVGGSFSGTLSDTDPEVVLTAGDDRRTADVYQVDLAAGQTLIVTMESTAFDTYLKLLRDEAFVARNDDAGSTQRSEIRHTAQLSGTYTIYAGTFSEAGRGAYSLVYRIE